MDKNLKTIIVAGTNLECGQVLVGEMGGLSNVYEVNPSSSIPGLLAVETEHGFLYLDPDGEYAVLEEKSL